MNYPIRVPALRVEQPIGVYYVTILGANTLLDVAFSDTLSATYDPESRTYILDGTQRLSQPKRLDAIAAYINRIDASFPNAIILAANFRSEDGLIEGDEEGDDGDDDAADENSRRWKIENEDDEGRCTLVIPTSDKLAAVIDGQHRLFAFTRAEKARQEMKLLCSVFLDLPKPYQAQLFATINSTQKPVDKSLTYELFGYNISDEEEAYWSPDKVAVFLTRKLGLEQASPLCGRIRVAPRKDEALARLTGGEGWKVSTAVVVDGILRLFSTNPKADTTLLLRNDHARPKRSDLGGLRVDRSPLRVLYLESNDLAIYRTVLNYLNACAEVFWQNAGETSYIVKTVGIQALFDVLRRRIHAIFKTRDVRIERFVELLSPARSIDFSTEAFRNASGSGRSFIRRAIESAIDGTR